MFKKKKKVEIPQDNFYDRNVRIKWGELLRLEEQLHDQVKIVLIQKEVIELYPDGSDKDKAIKDFQQSQLSMIATIGSYDSCRADFQRYITEYRSLLVTTKDWVGKVSSSHDIVENACLAFYRGY